MASSSTFSRGSQSGLKSVTRDFSTTLGASEPKSSQEIYWPSTPAATRQKPKIDGAEAKERELKELEAKLKGNMIMPLKDSRTMNKRPSDSGADSKSASAAKKPRKLPPGYEDNSKPPVNSSDVVPSPATAAASKGKISSVFLSTEQLAILKLAKDGASLFYTGSAGTGKSVLLRHIIQELRAKHSKAFDAVAVTASTGIAACNIGGVTIHSFAGIGLAVEKAEELASKVAKNRKASARWLRTKVLIIDEISMVDAELFDKLATVGSLVRKKPEPFGGIQVIVTGDFFQLPPVSKGSSQVRFAFEAKYWRETIKRTFNLTKVFRQRDQEFVGMLNEMRFGQLCSRSIEKFRSLSREIVYEDGIEATELFPRREDVDRSNTSRMSRLHTQAQVFKAKDAGNLQDQNQRQKMLANFMAPESLTLRIDCQVMLIKNVDETLVNGSIGKVVQFADPVAYSYEQNQELSIGGGGNNSKKPPSSAGGKLYPVVEFILPNGMRRPCLMMPEIWKVELPNGDIQVSRTQLPLILSWAMSIHKSQGQTLERVKVDLARVFEKGQAYVALSRATSLEGLQVLNFEPRKVFAHPKVIQWSKTLETLIIESESTSDDKE